MGISRPRLSSAATIFGVADEGAYADRHARFMAAKNRLVTDRTDTITAYVNGSRWVADCPTCGAGMGVHPEWKTARCFGCGSVYAVVVFPVDWATIEDLLWERPEREHNWQTSQTVTDIALNNDAQGLPGVSLVMAATVRQPQKDEA